MDASMVVLLPYPIVMVGCSATKKKHYAPIRIQFINALVDKRKYNKFSIIQNMLIMLHFSINHVELNLG